MATDSLPRRLNLGCGFKKLEGFHNVDVSCHVQPDLVWNLDTTPYPLPRSYFEEIRAFDVIEHLTDIPRFMSEIHALLVDGGHIEITTPHFSSSNTFTDPTHRFHLGYFSFDYFTSNHEVNYYSLEKFEFVERRIYFHTTVINRIVSKLANRYPHRYEQRFAWMFPAWFLSFRLRAVK